MARDLRRRLRDIEQDADGRLTYKGAVYRITGVRSGSSSRKVRSGLAEDQGGSSPRKVRSGLAEDQGSSSPRKVRAVLAAALLLIAACVIGSGCISAAGASDAYYVIIPFIGEVSALFALVWNMIRLIYDGGGVRDYVLESAGKKIPGACRILAAFAVTGLIMSGIYLVRNGWGGRPAESAVYLLLKFSSACLALWYDSYYGKVSWEAAEHSSSLV